MCAAMLHLLMKMQVDMRHQGCLVASTMLLWKEVSSLPRPASERERQTPRSSSSATLGRLYELVGSIPQRERVSRILHTRIRHARKIYEVATAAAESALTCMALSLSRSVSRRRSLLVSHVTHTADVDAPTTSPTTRAPARFQILSRPIRAGGGSGGELEEGGSDNGSAAPMQTSGTAFSRAWIGRTDCPG